MDERIRIVDTPAEMPENLDRRGIQGAQRHRAMNPYLSMKARYIDVPISGTFGLTPLCNLDCRMCCVYLNKNRFMQADIPSLPALLHSLNLPHAIGSAAL